MEEERDLQRLSEGQECKNWTTAEVARYVIQHSPLPQTDPGKVAQVLNYFKMHDMKGERLINVTKSEWEAFILEVVYLIELPVVEHIRGENHPVINTIIDIPTKLQDCRSGIWFTALTYFTRTQQYDQIFKEEEGLWCHDRAGRPYFNPGSWRRYGFYPQTQGESKDDVEEILRNWHVAYHGTKFINVDSIVLYGLVPPGATVGGKLIENKRGRAGAVGAKIPVYVSPSISYASHWCYTSPRKENDEYVYCVFQVRVRPGHFRIQGNTLWEGGWGDKNVLYDERFGPDELEWLVEDASHVRVTGLMVHKTKTNPQEEVSQLFQKHKKLTENKRAEGKGQWKWNCAERDGKTLDPNGPWKDYSPEMNIKLEKAYLHWQSVCYLGQVDTDKGINPYFVDFMKMEQIRCNDHKLRRIIRRDVLVES